MLHVIARLLLFGALVAWSLSLLLPFITVTTFYFFDDSQTLPGSVAQLWGRGEYLLAVIIAIFSLILPLAKILMLFLSSYFMHSGKSRLVIFLEKYGHWSMLDIFVIALLLVSFKLDSIVSASVHAGFYAFTFCVILTMLANTLLKSTKMIKS